ncbi:MAG: CoA ester lyase [Rhodospirillales bacterium]|nr:CoA ester lyase [Rhodospirillales bacterium]
MRSSARPRRSFLYMPGSNARALEKGRSLKADGLILDLEDAVAPEAKDVARSQISEAVGQGGYGNRELLVRVNGLDSPFGEADLSAMAAIGADGILLPKVENRNMVMQAIAILDASGGSQDLPVWCMMETPLGILHAEEIAFASPRVGGLVLGTSDLAKDLNATHTRDRLPFMASLEICILAAHAAGIAVLDGVHLDLEDEAGFRAACQQGKELGMHGKTLIHPKTIEAANQVFAPSADDIAWAKRIITAHKQAEQAGKGVVVVDGKLIENLHVESALQLIAMAEAIAAMDA